MSNRKRMPSYNPSQAISFTYEYDTHTCLLNDNNSYDNNSYEITKWLAPVPIKSAFKLSQVFCATLDFAEITKRYIV